MRIVQKEVIGDCELFLGDCREILPTLPAVEAVVTDPPYGIGQDGGHHRGGRGAMCSLTRWPRRVYADTWDTRPDGELLRTVLGAAATVILWGGQYFTDVLPVQGKWLVWDKQNTMPTYGDCELAWTNLPQTHVKMLRYSGNGILARERERWHPTQKPVGLMRWCVAQTQGRVLDPFMGSGSTGVACVELGRAFMGIEREERYFTVACERIAEATRQGILVQEVSSAPVQLALEGW